MILTMFISNMWVVFFGGTSTGNKDNLAAKKSGVPAVACQICKSET
jgi:hypothetical protein